MTLSIKELSVQVQDKTILHNVSMQFEIGKNYCILGKNGSWKSSLAMTVMGHPKYEIKQWDVILDWISIKDMEPNERSKAWIFLAFQHIPEIKWVKLFEFLRSVYDAKHWTTTSFLQFKTKILPLMESLQLDKEFLRRDLNVGFSGGERRKLEILQLKLLQPKYIFLDEIDSGLDVDAFKAVANLIAEANTGENTFIIITHIFTILEYVPINTVYVMQQGNIIKQGTKEIIETIKEKWFEEN